MATLSRLRACIAQRDALGAKTLEAFGSLSLSESQERDLFRELLPFIATNSRPPREQQRYDKQDRTADSGDIGRGDGLVSLGLWTSGFWTRKICQDPARRFACRRVVTEGTPFAGAGLGKQGLLAWVTSRDKRQKQPWKVAYNQLLVFLGLAWVFLGSCADERTHYQRSDSTRSRVSTSAAKAWLQLMGL
ncbi:hypothetical protein CEP51_003369 [Fusarium floridanum]|uniref:Uncharacterized protein n=1 Tax=Fusarium floridanum TaxID=1325733 RepID=A0A428S734_9HYPO|nr:hypothetical protein CEP51_003369 [Fusarium floridanum]